MEQGREKTKEDDFTLALIEIDDIFVGERIRKNLGNIEALALDIQEIGLLQPIVIRLLDKEESDTGGQKHYKLLAGRRRLEAHKFLGRRLILALIRKPTQEVRSVLLS